MSDLMPKEWILGKASDFVVSPKNDIVDGPFGSNLKASEYQLSGTPIIRLQNIKRLHFINKNIKYVSNEKAVELSRHSYKKGDIVITKLGDPLGLACIIPENFQDGIIVADLVRLRINDLAFDKRYLTYLLNSPLVISQLNKHIKGTTRPRINLGIIRDLNLPIASISEQKIIAEKLDTLLAQVDSTKARLKQIPQILKRFRQAVLTIAINGKLTEIFRVQNKLKDNWVEMPLERLACSDKYSLGIGPFGSNLKVEDYREEGHPLIFVRDIRACSFSNSETRYIDSSKFEELKAHRAKPGDLLITKMGDPPGDAAIYPSDCEEAVITADCIKLRVANELALSKFILFTIMSNEFREKVIEISAGVAQQKVNLKNFKKLQLNIPPLPEQAEIVRRVEQLFTYADTIEKQVNNALTRVNNLTQSILAKAFRGELTAQWRAENPELINGENSAAALLEKIKAERATSSGKKAARKKA
ncbi:restriction endonuclease subunit S [Mangrovibacter phragmitis]|uniref:restriction endonuclease subunit S n=1 Tax=Mangrovibacter phragmitis TaxID=1691903 RepID=UPI00336AB4C8